MLRIAVVDDEERIRLGLGKLIADAGAQYEVVGTFASGQELLNQWSAMKPELVITDIRMPQMSGLQLMAQAKEQGWNAKFAVLSGYNDFEYARTAMRQGALEYLLKPVNMKDLYRLLATVHETLERERGEERLESDDLVSFLLCGEERRLPEQLLQEVTGRLDRMPLFRKSYAVLLLRTSPDLTEAQLAGLTEDWGADRQIAASDANRKAVIFSIGPSGHANTVRERAVTLLQRMPPHTRAKAGMSGVFFGSGWLPQAYREAETAFEHAWYSAESRWCSGETERVPRKEERYRLLRMAEKGLLPALQLGEYARAEEAFGLWLNETAALRLGWRELAEACSDLEALLAEELELRSIRNEQFGDLGAPRDYENWRAFAEMLKERMTRKIGLLENARNENRTVETIKCYIHEHYAEELELQQLADIVYLTPSYLSKLFKTETGETITDYIIRERIEHAKRLLREDIGLKTYMVGERVGYPDPAYFTKVFKKMTGKTPKEYRDLVR
ncbi:response regulator [Paenibacillus thailandensis]|uniref:Response regulator n=1 Tax=Paenibacillus thailandensis TaxID=393250 RepID=A0ABW5QVU4_9BACL